MKRGRAAGPLPLLSGEVVKVVRDGAGGWIASGFFKTLSDPSLENLVRIRADRTLDQRWRPVLPQGIYPIATSGTTLYYLSNRVADNTLIPMVGALDIPSAQPTAWQPALAFHSGDVIVDLVVGNGAVLLTGWIAGRYTVVAFNAVTGQLLWQYDLSDRANNLLVDGPTLYISGRFRQIGALARSCLAAIEIASGQILPLRNGCRSSNSLASEVPEPPSDPEIQSMAVIGNRLYLQIV